MRMNAKMKFLSRILCLGLVVSMALGILCACDKDDDFRNPQNGEPTLGEFYDLQTAYDNGWLSKGDLRNIAYHYADDAQKKGFKPTPKNPDMLSEETALAIKESYIKPYQESRPDSNANDVPIDGYYGTYNGLVAVYIRYGGAYCVVTEKNIGGIEFVFPDSHEILVWKSNEQ
ncbi:MAG: hypothetical protein K2J16_00045 [Clostridia bacterium]|nr:hypothetical protein [Clostridia bacterium]